jgi:hypothetical protein
MIRLDPTRRYGGVSPTLNSRLLSRRARLAALAADPVSVAAEVRPINFPVDGIVRHTSDFGAPRSGGRSHEGNDLFGPKLQPLLAAASGRITYVRSDAGGSAGNMLTITDRDGWQYRYMHLNNDTPGTDDGLNPLEWAFARGIAQGSAVVAGQRVGYMGDSGNAEATAPHLHFEIRRPDGSALDPYESLRAAVRTPASTGRDVAANPKGGYYVLTGDGTVHAYDGAPALGYPKFHFDIARGLAVMPDGLGYVVLDGYGGIHRFGSAKSGFIAGFRPPYFGFDIARSIDISPDGDAIVVLDGWGATHVTGEGPASPNAYWPGWDIARGVAFTPTGDGLYVLDAFGGVHISGDAIEDRNHPYWLGWDIARSVVATRTTAGDGYAILDGFGGIHKLGEAPKGPAGSWDTGNRMVAVDFRAGRYITVSRDGTSRRW